MFHTCLQPASTTLDFFFKLSVNFLKIQILPTDMIHKEGPRRIKQHFHFMPISTSWALLYVCFPILSLINLFDREENDSKKTRGNSCQSSLLTCMSSLRMRFIYWSFLGNRCDQILTVPCSNRSWHLLRHSGLSISSRRAFSASILCVRSVPM